MLSHLLSSALLLSVAAAQTSNTTCVTGLHMIVARASTEAPGEGIIGDVATMIQDAIPGSDSVAVVYPATLEDYFTSEAAGTAAMTKLVQQYLEACPDGKIALLGYSQGAQVVGDTLCGTSSEGFIATPPLNSSYNKNVVAIIQMGDPTYVPGLSYDAGTSKKPGAFPRHNTTACMPYASRIQSYCDTNDLYCAQGDSVVVHIGYVSEYGNVAAAFVGKEYKLAAAGSATSSTGSSSPASTSATPSSSSPATGAGVGGAGQSTGMSGSGAATQTATVTTTTTAGGTAAQSMATVSVASPSQGAGARMMPKCLRVGGAFGVLAVGLYML